MVPFISSDFIKGNVNFLGNTFSLVQFSRPHFPNSVLSIMLMLLSLLLLLFFVLVVVF